ncbi:hypothetical protein AVEN_142467-1 [Araneus ventricosus]|uniref:Uncharacterized protein n=1 Tax=Araneus ventricosus TaxID=182803 RepID=A0A4Y2DU24_ARAVE|nr:hypothetical protein AVEN_142467-1 [Araneus ventricosus]
MSRSPSGKVLASASEFPGSKPDSTDEQPCLWARCTLNLPSAVVGQTPPAGVMRKSGSPAEVKFLLFDHGPWQKSPRAASKRKVIVRYPRCRNSSKSQEELAEIRHTCLMGCSPDCLKLKYPYTVVEAQNKRNSETGLKDEK